MSRHNPLDPSIDPPPADKRTAADYIVDAMETALNTFQERNKVYGDNFLNVGKVMDALFPQGVTLNSVADFTRFHLLELDVVKLSRYCNNFSKGGHQDSIHDQAIYAFMVEGCDAWFNRGSK